MGVRQSHAPNRGPILTLSPEGAACAPRHMRAEPGVGNSPAPKGRPITWIRRILLFKKGPRGPSNAGEKVLMVL